MEEDPKQCGSPLEAGLPDLNLDKFRPS
jgi:hypothetical protein